MLHHGLRVEIDPRHEFLPGALLVTPHLAPQPWWIVHKTPNGAVAVRLWPGLAEIVRSVPEALAKISEAVDAADQRPEG